MNKAIFIIAETVTGQKACLKFIDKEERLPKKTTI